MNKIIKHKILAGVMLLGSMLAGSSCEDIVGINVTPETPFADKTLYEVIVNDPDLSDFVEILNACGAECADSLFNQSRVYTGWAPVNDLIPNKKDSILDRIAAGYREDVFLTYVKQHIANHVVAANGTLDSVNKVMVLNGKKPVFTGNYKDGFTFSGVELKDKNIRAKNGILHKIATPSEYNYSIWEYLKVAENVDSVAQYLYSYNVTKFNEGQSLKGPMVDGAQTFLDSVFTTTNSWLNNGGVGLIDSEDSTYIVYVPSNAMWEREVAKADSYYAYDMNKKMTDAEKYERDSLRKRYPRYHNLKFMTYSVNEQRHVNSSDSMKPAHDEGDKKLFAKADLDANVVYQKELSNGIFKVVDSMPYKHTDLWHDTIFVEGENENMWNYGSDQDAAVGTKSAFESEINQKDSALIGAKVSGSYYMNFGKESGKPTAKYKIPKVLSAKYYVAAIFVPANITSVTMDSADIKYGKYSFTIKQQVYNENGILKSVDLFKNGTNKGFIVNRFGMDTLYLTVDDSRDGERVIIEPNCCEFYGNGNDASEYSVTLDIQSQNPTSAEKTKYGDFFGKSIRLDKIMLIPVPETEE